VCTGNLIRVAEVRELPKMFAPITWAQIDYQRHRADRLMDTDWTKDLKPDEAQAALDALNASKAPITARKGVDLLKTKKGARVKVGRGTQATGGALNDRVACRHVE
jgi:hypothetical protein